MNTADRTFSVIVNTVDRAGPLATLLRALEHQSYPHFEVVVVVGPSKDNTLDVLEPYGNRVSVLRCPEANLSLSRNIGLLAARGDIVAYIDDDAVPCNQWLEQLARLFADPLLDGTGGEVYSVYPQAPALQHRDGIISSLADQVDVRASRLEHLLPQGAGAQWVERMMGTNMAFRRRALLELGGFDSFYVYIAEEGDLALRMVQAGMVVQPVREAPVYHLPATSRNRIVFTHIGRWWWMETRSKIYYCIKNGPKAGDSQQEVAARCLHLVHGHWLRYVDLARQGQLPKPRAAVMALNEVRGAVSGIAGGLGRRRGLIEPAAAQAALADPTGIKPFQNAQSCYQPAVDPTGSHITNITMPEPPLRVCLLSTTYPPNKFDGIGRQANFMARGFFELGHEVHVVTLGDREQVSFYDGAYVHQIKYTLDRYERFRSYPDLIHALNYGHAVYDKIRRLALNDGVEVVDSPLWLFPGLVTAISGELPVVCRVQTGRRQVSTIQHEESGEAAIMGEMERALIQTAAHVVPNSRGVAAAIEKVYGLNIPDDRKTIIPIGIMPAPDEEIRPFDIGQGDRPLTVLYVGRLEKRKGIRALFEAIPTVLEKQPGTRFLLAGADNSHFDGFEQEAGMSYPAFFASRHPDLADRVTFIGGVNDDELQKLYQTCDLFVAPSLYESFGIVYLEAMNYAKPVIGCRAGGIPEVVEEGVTGWLVEPDNSRELAEAMISALSAPKELAERGMAGRQRLLSRFTHIQMARETAKVYARVARRETMPAKEPSGRGEWRDV